MLNFIKGRISQSLALNTLINTENMAPIASNLSSEYDLKYAVVPICDIIAGCRIRKSHDIKEKIEESSSDEEEEAPKVVKKRIVKVVSDNEEKNPIITKKKTVKIVSDDEDEDKENSDHEKDDSDYELTKVTPKKEKLSVHKSKAFKSIKKEILSGHKTKGLSPYERMIEEKRAERIALLKSMEIDQIKSEISDAIGGIKQLKKKSITKSYKKVQYPTTPEPLRRSRRLANVEADLSEDALTKSAVKNSFQVYYPEPETLPSEITFEAAMKSASSYDECIRDLSIQDTKLDLSYISYDKDVLKNMTLNEFNVCKVVPARITSEAWCPVSEDLIVAAGDKFGNLGLWKIQDSETTPHLFKPHAGNIPHMQFCVFNPVQLITASYDGTIRCGDLVKHQFSEIYASERSRCTWFDFLSPSTFLVSHSDGQVALVDRKTKGKTGEKRHSCHDFTIKTVCVHPVNKNVFLTADNKSIVRLWDLRKLQTKPVFEIRHHTRTVNSAFFSPITGNSILTTSLDDSICIFDSTNLTSDIKLKAKMRHNNCTGRWLSIFKATWLPNSDDYFAVGSMEHPRKVEIFDKDLNLYHNMIHDNLTTITSVQRFHPQRSALAAGNSSGKVFVFT